MKKGKNKKKQKGENETEDTKKISSGDLLSFGSINLLLTLNLEKKDLQKYKIKWDELENLENLKFIRKHKKFWDRIELSSPNKTLDLLIKINKSSQKLIKIGYIGFKKIIYKDEQIEFQDFVEEITNQNGLFLTSCDVCDCTICIQLVLIYGKKQKNFVLSGSPEAPKEEDKTGVVS